MNILDLTIVRIDSCNSYLINEFLSKAGTALRTFRYFQNRGVEVIEQHIYTCVLSRKGSVIGYGHLDKEKEDVWLGIAIVEEMTGKGCGKFLLNFLINEARKTQVEIVKLSVDSSNAVAKRMYLNFGFKEFHRTSEIEFYKLQLH